MLDRFNTDVYMNAYIHAYIHTYIHTYIHAYIHAYMHICIQQYSDRMHTQRGARARQRKTARAEPCLA